MALLSKEEFFARGGRRYETVPVPELGEDAEVRVRSLTGDEWEEYEQSLSETKVRGNKVEVKANNRHRRAKLLVMCVVDEDGQPIFDKRDVIRVSGMPAGALDRIYEVCERLCGQDSEAEERAEANFGETPDGRSTTGSPSPSAGAPAMNSSPEPLPVN